jgi:hypothetical protein
LRTSARSTGRALLLDERENEADRRRVDSARDLELRVATRIGARDSDGLAGLHVLEDRLQIDLVGRERAANREHVEAAVAEDQQRRADDVGDIQAAASRLHGLVRAATCSARRTLGWLRIGGSDAAAALKRNAIPRQKHVAVGLFARELDLRNLGNAAVDLNNGCQAEKKKKKKKKKKKREQSNNRSLQQMRSYRFEKFSDRIFRKFASQRRDERPRRR